MKVGTDGVLLGAWCNCSKAKSALDIGTGTGLIALMLAQRNPGICVKALDSNSDAIADARENFANSPWGSRLKAIESGIEDFEFREKFDLIVSNPPFFENSLPSPSEGRTAARHTAMLGPKELAEASSLLSEKGTFSGIYPPNTFEKFRTIMSHKNFRPRRLTLVKPTPNKETHRVLFEYIKGWKSEPKTTELIIEKAGRHNYSDEYKSLTKDFYLKM